MEGWINREIRAISRKRLRSIGGDSFFRATNGVV